MKILYKNVIFLIILVSCIITIPGCDDPEPESNYSFEVISSDDGFVGYYKVDGGSAEVISSSPLGSSTIYHSFEKELKSPESILISATGASTTTSSISIYVYEKTKLVESVTVTQSDSAVKVTATLSYTFGSSE
jgi:hypothetical protein